MAYRNGSRMTHLMCTSLLILSTVSLVQCKSVGGNNVDQEENFIDHNDHEHGGVKMGVVNHGCDDGEYNIEKDWDNSTDYDYKCQENEEIIFPIQLDSPVPACLAKDDIPKPLHICMNDEISYDETPPRGGRHRPLWPVYGEYLYVPPQRWLHSLEHGAAVFLYHPCADPTEIEKFKNLAEGCLRRRIVTPYRDQTQPFSVITWGCRLMLGTINEESEAAIVDFIRETALKTEERGVTRHGQYTTGLIKQAEVITDLMDTVICPNKIAENMLDH